MAWSPYIFSDRITQVMIRYSMNGEREITLLKNQQKLWIYEFTKYNKAKKNQILKCQNVKVTER